MSAAFAKTQVSQSKVGNNPLVKQTVRKAEGIQQREQLRQKVLSIFLKDYAKNSKSLQTVIEEEVDNFFKNEKINETSLKELKSKIQALTLKKAPSQASAKSQNQNAQVEDNKSVHSQVSQKSHITGGSQKQQQKTEQNIDQTSHKDEDGVSVTSSKAPQSVYYLEGDENDEWATIVKFDTELFKKNQNQKNKEKLNSKKNEK